MSVENLPIQTSLSRKIQTTLPNIHEQLLNISQQTNNISSQRHKNEKEYDIIKEILITNNYDTQILNRSIKTINTKTTTRNNSPTTLTQPQTKCATFTYVGHQTKYMTKLFKRTNENIAYKIKNTLEYTLTHNTHTNNTGDEFYKSGTYIN
jgi:hypothetical protein